MSTFTEFKEKLYSRINDITIFDCSDFSLFKVALDGLKVDYAGKGNVRAFALQPKLIFDLVTFGKKIRNQSPPNKLQEELKLHFLKEVIVSDVGRVVKSDNEFSKSFYFENIIEAIGRKKLVYVSENHSLNDLNFDSRISEILKIAEGRPLTSEEKKLRNDVILTYEKIESSRIFSKHELKNIKFAFHKFFMEYKAWNFLLGNLPNLKRAFFVCHYHKEGQIRAYKKHKIVSIELQHGIIAPQDIFYVLPPIVAEVQSKLLCADKILVYGQYWQGVLEKGYEYKREQIDIVGYFPFEAAEEVSQKKQQSLKELIKGRVNVVLITTQTFLEQHFIKYVDWLQDQVDRSSTVILLKPHPSEDSFVYKRAFELSNVTFVVDDPLSVLFPLASIHISIYSTTLYDALRFKVRNYCLYVEDCKDYVKGIADAGIAQLITATQNPLILDNLNSKIEIRPDFYFEKFNRLKINEVL